MEGSGKTPEIPELISVDTRNLWLAADDSELLKDCKLDFFKSTGPGGQKKNKSESAVRLTHLSSKVTASATESRHQGENRRNAIKRLRMEIALTLRSRPGKSKIPPDISPNNPKYILWVAHVLDVLASVSWSVKDAAEKLDLSSSRLVRLLARSPELWQQVNRHRQINGIAPLRKP